MPGIGRTHLAWWVGGNTWVEWNGMGFRKGTLRPNIIPDSEFCCLCNKKMVELFKIETGPHTRKHTMQSSPALARRGTSYFPSPSSCRIGIFHFSLFLISLWTASSQEWFKTTLGWNLRALNTVNIWQCPGSEKSPWHQAFRRAACHTMQGRWWSACVPPWPCPWPGVTHDSSTRTGVIQWIPTTPWYLCMGQRWWGRMRLALQCLIWSGRECACVLVNGDSQYEFFPGSNENQNILRMQSCWHLKKRCQWVLFRFFPFTKRP